MQNQVKVWQADSNTWAKLQIPWYQTNFLNENGIVTIVMS